MSMSHESDQVLSKEVKAILLKVSTEKDIAAEGLPLILESTVLELLAQLNIGIDTSTKFTTITGLHPGIMSDQIAEDIFGYLSNQHKNSFKPIVSWVTKSFGEHPQVINEATIGMALVIRAFNMQNPTILDTIGNYSPKDIMTTLEAIPVFPESQTILVRTSENNIPPYQTDLGRLIDIYSRFSNIPTAFQLGAVAGYRLVEKAVGT